MTFTASSTVPCGGVMKSAFPLIRRISLTSISPPRVTFYCRLLRLDGHAQPGKRLSAARRSTRQDAPFAQRLRQRAAVDVLELAADRYAAREPRDLELACGKQLGDVMCGRLALVGKVGRQHDFANRTVLCSFEQPVEANFLGTDAVERRKAAHEHKI